MDWETGMVLDGGGGLEAEELVDVRGTVAGVLLGKLL